MRKIAFALAVVLFIVSLTIPVSATEPRAIMAVPGLTFEGNVASCSLTATGNNTSEHFEATIQLYRAGRVLTTWTAEGDGYLFFTDTVTVARGYSYKLVVDLTIDGESFDVPTVTKICE